MESQEEVKQVGGNDDSLGVAFFLSSRKKVLVQLLCLRSPCEMEMDFGWEPPFPHVLLAPILSMCVPLIIPVESPIHLSRIVVRFAQKGRKRKQWPVANQ